MNNCIDPVQRAHRILHVRHVLPKWSRWTSILRFVSFHFVSFIRLQRKKTVQLVNVEQTADKLGDEGCLMGNYSGRDTLTITQNIKLKLEN
jgi:hypothetical protein